MRPQAGSPKGPLPKDLREPAPAVTHHLPTDTCKTDPDLAAVVAAWPEATRGDPGRHPGDGEGGLGEREPGHDDRPALDSVAWAFPPQTEPPFPWRRVPVRNSQE